MERCQVPIYQGAFTDQHPKKRQFYPIFVISTCTRFYLIQPTISGRLEHSISLESWVRFTNRNMGKYGFSPMICSMVGMNITDSHIPMIFRSFRSNPRCPRPCCRPPCPRRPFPRLPTRQSSRHPITLRLQDTRLERYSKLAQMDHCAGDEPSQLLESDDPRDGECGEALISASK